ncbi:MAG: hypothetical protein PVI86_12760 [Phycisphaerae bacterium]|jgi:hypothetical protein
MYAAVLKLRSLCLPFTVLIGCAGLTAVVQGQITLSTTDDGWTSGARFRRSPVDSPLLDALLGGEPDCFIASAPQEDPITPDVGYGTKNRYLSFQAGDSGRSQAVQVRFVSLPGYEYAEGRAKWVQQPFEVSEASGSKGETPPPTHWASALGCYPHVTDWTTYGTVDVFDDAIIPGATFEVRAFDADCDPLRGVPLGPADRGFERGR